MMHPHSISKVYGLKILLLSLEYTPELNGGVGTHVFELSEELGRQGHKVNVLTYAAAPRPNLSRGNVEVHFVSLGAERLARSAGASVPQSIFILNEELYCYAYRLIQDEKLRPDIIAFFNWITFRAATRVSEDLGIPVVGRISFLHEPIERYWGDTPDPEISEEEARLFRTTNDLITVSRSMQDLIHEVHGVPHDRLHLVNNGLNPAPFLKAGAKPENVSALKRLIAPNGEKVILYAGRLHPMKGILELLESAAQVVDEFPNVCYLIAGEPDSRAYGTRIQESLAQHKMLGTKVRFLGRVTRQEVMILFRIAHLAVMPSIYEPFANVAVETMAAAVPAVATDEGGFRDIIQHGKNGLLVPLHETNLGTHEVDVADLANAQLSLLRDDNFARSIGEAGRQHVLKEFTVQKMARLTLDVYHAAIN
jgi:glycosyltransferase involved in cell wall biosynthesis